MKLFILTLYLIVIIQVHGMKYDDVSAFFLKAPKSVPRAGRAAPGSYDGFFLKASKSVPRIGRRDGSEYNAIDDYQQWLKTNFYKYSPNDWKYMDDTQNTNEDNNGNDKYYEENKSHRNRRYNLDDYSQSGKDINFNKELPENNYQMEA